MKIPITMMVFDKRSTYGEKRVVETLGLCLRLRTKRSSKPILGIQDPANISEKL